MTSGIATNTVTAMTIDNDGGKKDAVLERYFYVALALYDVGVGARLCAEIVEEYKAASPTTINYIRSVAAGFLETAALVLHQCMHDHERWF